MPERFALIARSAGGAALLVGLVAFTAPAAFGAGTTSGSQRASAATVAAQGANSHRSGDGDGDDRRPAPGCPCSLPASFAYSEFSPGNVNEANGDSDGPAAFGGTTSLSHFAISTVRSELPPFRLALVAGGPVTGGGTTTIHYGNGLYDSTISGVADDHGHLYPISAAHLQPYFSTTAAADSAFSSKLAALYTSPGDMALVNSSTLTLQATTTESNHIYIWDLTPGELHGITSIDIEGVPSGGTVVVNVTDAGTVALTVTSVTLDGKSSTNRHAAPGLAASTIFNFPAATALTLTGDWAGTIFAPGATTTYSNGHLWGSIDSASLTGSDQFTSGPLLRPFCIPTSGPGTSPGNGGPGTQLPEGQPVEMVTGSAVLLGGAVLWRRRRSRRKAAR